jgi:hypothetical protein
VRNRGVLLLALLIAAVLAAGSGYALYNAGDDSSPAVGALPTTSATPSATPSETPSETPSATPTETASPTPAVTASPTSTRSSSPRATSGSHTYAYPKPSRTYDGLQVTLTSNPQHGTVGQNFRVTIEATDGDGKLFFNGLSWGDGATVPSQGNPQRCKSYPPLTSPPGAYQPQPDARTGSTAYRFDHKYLAPPAQADHYDITVHIASVNADCRPNGPKREDRTLTVRVYVTAPKPTPSP